MIDVLTRNYEIISLSGIGTLILLAYLQILFQSPFDFLTFLDSDILFVLVVVLIYFYKGRSERSWVAAGPQYEAS